MRLWDSNGCGQPGGRLCHWSGEQEGHVEKWLFIAGHCCSWSEANSLCVCVSIYFFFSLSYPLLLPFLSLCPVFETVFNPVSSFFLFLSIFLSNYKFHLSGGFVCVWSYFVFFFFSYSILIHLKVDFGLPGATSSWSLVIILMFSLYFLVPVPFKSLLSFCRVPSSRFQYPQITVFWK